MSGLKVVVLGCSGLVGERLSERLLTCQEMGVCDGGAKHKVTKFTFCDLNPPKEGLMSKIKGDSRASFLAGDLCDEEYLAKAFDPEGCARVTVYHLAALLSGYAEEKFDLGMKINLFGTLKVIEQIRALGKKLGAPQVYIYTSTDYVTMFNDHNKTNPCNEESFRLSPVSYGCQKACMELMVSDYSRKGFIDGRVARLSAVLGRPGWSNSISFPYTGIFTQTMGGKPYDVSLPMNIDYPCSMLSNNVESYVKLGSDVHGSEIGHNRVVQFAAESLTLSTILQATKDVSKEVGANMGEVRIVDASKGKQTCKEINVCPRVDCAKAKRLGLPMNFDIKEIIREYYNSHVKPVSSEA